MSIIENKFVRRFTDYFRIDEKDLVTLFQRDRMPDAKIERKLFIIGALLMPITFGGMLLGFVRGYRKFMFPFDMQPEFEEMPRIVKVAMAIGGVLIWLFLVSLVIGLMIIANPLIGSDYLHMLVPFTVYIVVNLSFCMALFAIFNSWRVGVRKYFFERSKYGTARYATDEELAPFITQKGFFMGGMHNFSEPGHILTVAGTRAGKFIGLIAPNLLGMGGYEDSWVVVDPKGEATSVTARYQMNRPNRNVVILNPWGEHFDRLAETDTYNPLDILKDRNSIHLVDDAGMIAEMIIPVEKADKDKFFADNARSILTGLLLHLVTSQKPEDILLTKVWEWIRFTKKDWEKLLEDMAVNDDPVNGDIVKKAGNEIMKIMSAGERTFGIIMAYLLQATDFIKSPSLQKAMKTGFDPKTLTDGNTTLYIIIPADKLVSHFRWLRLIITTTMRAVVRNKNKRVCFLLDEFAALGYMPEIETALSTYAGYNITLWPILQSLIQLNAIYETNWETFIGNTAVKQFFGINDNFTAEYVSQAIGMASHTKAVRNFFSIKEVVANERLLVTLDEVRRGSANNMFVFIKSLPVTTFRKQAYYLMPGLFDNDEPRFDSNPYYVPDPSLRYLNTSTRRSISKWLEGISKATPILVEVENESEALQYAAQVQEFVMMKGHLAMMKPTKLEKIKDPYKLVLGPKSRPFIRVYKKEQKEEPAI